MDILCLVSVLYSLLHATQAIICHDCTSWNPYCREAVQEPFPDAVAAVDCGKTNTCFVKQEQNGVITRGCTDWWMESQVDIRYVGCQTQEVPWVGKQTWCFCKTDYCNAGSVEKMLKWELAPDSEDGYEGDETNLVSDSKDNKDKLQKSAMTKPRHLNQFNDFAPEYYQEAEKQNDPTWMKWWWHADSDRPLWEAFSRKVTVHSEAGANAVALVKSSDNVNQLPTTAAAVGRKNRPWDKLFPWWQGKNSWSKTTTGNTRATAVPATQPPFNWSTEGPKVFENLVKSENNLDYGTEEDWESNKSPFDPSIPKQAPEVEPLPDDDITKAEFFCWDCFSDSPLCKERVDTTQAAYVGKTPCPSTNKCFVRKDNGVTYRGCADGWTSSIISLDYVGCKMQSLWGREVEWCFCSASLCNGDSMQDIETKYFDMDPHPFRKIKTSKNVTTVEAGQTTAATETISSKATVEMTTSGKAIFSTQKDNITTAGPNTDSTITIPETTKQVVNNVAARGSSLDILKFSTRMKSIKVTQSSSLPTTSPTAKTTKVTTASTVTEQTTPQESRTTITNGKSFAALGMR